MDNYLLTEFELIHEEIQAWIDNKSENGRWKLSNISPELVSADEYRNHFFRHLHNIFILSPSF